MSYGGRDPRRAADCAPYRGRVVHLGDSLMQQ